MEPWFVPFGFVWTRADSHDPMSTAKKQTEEFSSEVFAFPSNVAYVPILLLPSTMSTFGRICQSHVATPE